MPSDEALRTTTRVVAFRLLSPVAPRPGASSAGGVGAASGRRGAGPWSPVRRGRTGMSPPVGVRPSRTARSACMPRSPNEFGVEADGGELRVDGGGEGEVVEAGDGEVVGDAQARGGGRPCRRRRRACRRRRRGRWAGARGPPSAASAAATGALDGDRRAGRAQRGAGDRAERARPVPGRGRRRSRRGCRRRGAGSGGGRGPSRCSATWRTPSAMSRLTVAAPRLPVGVAVEHHQGELVAAGWRSRASAAMEEAMTPSRAAWAEAKGSRAGPMPSGEG